MIGTCPRCNLRGNPPRHLPGGRLKRWTGAGGDLLNLDARRTSTELLPRQTGHIELHNCGFRLTVTAFRTWGV